MQLVAVHLRTQSADSTVGRGRARDRRGPTRLALQHAEIIDRLRALIGSEAEARPVSSANDPVAERAEPGVRRPTRLANMPKLTNRQRQVASLLTTGAGDKEIAVRLGIGAATVEKHVSKLLRAVGASNRAAAVWLFLGGAHIAEQ